MSELVWDTYRCDCGGLAVMKLVSLVAHCPNCPRVYAHYRIGKGKWFASIEEANAAYAANDTPDAPEETR